MKFNLLAVGGGYPSTGRSTAYLRKDMWNDYSFVTMFHLALHDDAGEFHEIGDVKIGFRGQTQETPTYERLESVFEALGQEFFSLGQTVEFYKNLAKLPHLLKSELLISLRDVVSRPGLIDDIDEEDVFGTSLLRFVSLSVVRGQFARVLNGEPELTDFRFTFTRYEAGKLGPISLDFDVVASSRPSTNIHAIIGRNGIGKTTLLNQMTEAVLRRSEGARFIDRDTFGNGEIAKDYFSSVASVSFSAFDPFEPPVDRQDPTKGACYFYVGLKKAGDNRHRTIEELRLDIARHLWACFVSREKGQRWLRAIGHLGADAIFASMHLDRLLESFQGILEANEEVAFDSFFRKMTGVLQNMSSGHAAVLLTITFLVARVEEKTLVLLDEPESHLHPPLLSAFVRSLAELLHDRNGVAIVATHSPVVLQEVPRSCVWKLHRTGRLMDRSRPAIETFGENVGLLTSEVFKLEVEQSGFHALLRGDVASGLGYDEIIERYNGQLGLEARAVLGALVAERGAGRA